jgi:hypothetical protein
MERDDLLIYSVRMADKPTRYRSSFAMKEIVAGASALSNEERALLSEQQCLFDDDCSSSISSLNPWWGELTAVHYLLQENMHPRIGNAQYRRFWGEGELLNLPPYALGVAYPVYFACSLGDQFRGGHGFDGEAMSIHLAQRGKLPFSLEELKAVWGQNVFQGGPMAIGRFEHYKILMTILFDCLWPIWDEYKDYIQALSGYDKRAIAFLSERLLTGIVLYREKFMPRIPLHNIPLGFIGP